MERGKQKRRDPGNEVGDWIDVQLSKLYVSSTSARPRFLLQFCLVPTNNITIPVKVGCRCLEIMFENCEETKC